MMSENEKLSTALMSDMDKLADFDIWVAAVGMVALAGKRATERNRADINGACLRFVQEMGALVGTPDFPPKGTA